VPVPARHRQTASVIQPHERLPLPHPERVTGLTRAPASPGSPAVHELAGAQPDQPARDRRTQARADCCGPTSPACSDMQSRPRMIHRCARTIRKPHRLFHPERRIRIVKRQAGALQNVTSRWDPRRGTSGSSAQAPAVVTFLGAACSLGPARGYQTCPVPGARSRRYRTGAAGSLRGGHGIIDRSARSVALYPDVSSSRPIRASISSWSLSSTVLDPSVTTVRAPACRICSWGFASASANRE